MAQVSVQLLSEGKNMEPVVVPPHDPPPRYRLEVHLDGFTNATWQLLEFYAKQVHDRMLAIAAAEDWLNDADQERHKQVGRYTQRVGQPLVGTPVANVVNRMFDGGRHIVINPRRPEAEDFDCPIMLESEGIQVQVFLSTPIWRPGTGDRLLAQATIDAEVIAASAIAQKVRWSGDADVFRPVLDWHNQVAWRQLFGPVVTTVELGIGPNGRGEWLVHACWDPTAAPPAPD